MPVWLGEEFMVCGRNEGQGGNKESSKLEKEETYITECFKR